jgi:DNA-binding MarR family transcriptional regulator
MNQEHTTQNFELALVGFILQAKQNLLAVALEFGLSFPQALSLLLIDDTRHLPMKSYSQAYSCDAGNLTGIIDGLEEKGLVLRQQDPADRRIKVLKLLPKGAKLRKKMMEHLAAAHDEILSPLTAQERSNFVHCIQKIAR